MRCSAEGLSVFFRVNTCTGRSALCLILAAATGVVATSVPCFIQFVDLSSAFTLVTCNFLWPPFLFWAPRWSGTPVEGPAVAHMCMVVLGLIGMVFGMVGSYENLVIALRNFKE